MYQFLDEYLILKLNTTVTIPILKFELMLMLLLRLLSSSEAGQRCESCRRQNWAE